MKIRFTILSLVMVCILLPSCIKEEGPDREADIISFTLGAENNLVIGTPQIIEALAEVQVTVLDTTGFHKREIKPEILISAGATISPASGEPVKIEDYKLIYKVTSANGGEKTYVVSILPDKPQKYNFESWYQVHLSEGKRIYDMPSDAMWTNANAGVNLLYENDKKFPTRVTTDAHNGNYAVHLETVFGNKSIVNMMDIPIYAGSLFRGEFEPKLQLDVIKLAKFGQPHPKHIGKPITFKGWYKYKAGDVYQTCKMTSLSSKKKVEMHPEITDEFDIYAVLFQVEKGDKGNSQFLTAYDIQDMANSSLPIVATAIVEDRSEKDEYTKFDIPFTYTKAIDFNAHAYKMAIVFSSSKRGAFYEGAIGSVLVIDDVEIVSESIE